MTPPIPDTLLQYLFSYKTGFPLQKHPNNARSLISRYLGCFGEDGWGGGEYLSIYLAIYLYCLNPTALSLNGQNSIEFWSF